MDQLVNQIPKKCYMSGGRLKVLLVLRTPVGSIGIGAQHGRNPEALFLNVPGWKALCPSTAYDAKGLLTAAIRDDNPVLIFEYKLIYSAKGARAETGTLGSASEILSHDCTAPIGLGALRRAGSDATLAGTLLMAHRAMEAADPLELEGISAEVIDPRSLVPFDRELLDASVRKTGRLVIASGIAATAAERLSEYLLAPVARVTSPDVPSPFSPPLDNLDRPDAARIAEAARSTI